MRTLSQSFAYDDISARADDAPASLAEHWNTLREAAVVIAEYGNITDDYLGDMICPLPDFARLEGQPHHAAVAHAIGDMAAMLVPGLRALEAMASAGRNTTDAARTLWTELARSHASVMSLSNAAEPIAG